MSFFSRRIVFGMSQRGKHFEMIRIDAMLHAAFVVDVHTLGNRPKVILI